MMETNGWIKIHRKIVDWEWSDKTEMVSVWIHLLVMANTKPTDWHGTTIDRGQLVMTRESLAKKIGISEQTLRTCINRLEINQQITKKTTNKFTIITICNYDKYQVSEVANQPTNNQQITNNQPTNNQQKKEIPPITPKEKKEEDKNNNTHSIAHAHAREERIGYEVFGKFQNVMLKPVDLRQLEMNFGAVAVSESIEDLSCKLADGNIESINHYATLTHWLSFRKKNGTLTTTQQPKGRDLIGSNFTSD